jgi:hypothetical protein
MMGTPSRLNAGQSHARILCMTIFSAEPLPIRSSIGLTRNLASFSVTVRGAQSASLRRMR